MQTPKSFRLHIGIFGRRNVGKSSLLNRLTRQESSIVSSIAGTTTDPVEKPMELLPIGPVLFIDTAGVDDTGALGEQRIRKTEQIFDRTELALLVLDSTQGWSEFEERLLEEFRKRKIPVLAVVNKTDLGTPDKRMLERFAVEEIPFICCSSLEAESAASLREGLIRAVPELALAPPPILADLVPPGEFAVLVVPIDKEAPKGRLILPQVQTIRDLLDNGRYCVVLKEDSIQAALGKFRDRPAIVITDSQAFDQVSEIVPENIPLSSFSILFARQKGDLGLMAAGAAAIGRLKSNDKILIAESCSHHPITEDIGTEKIPNWLRKYCGFPLEIIHVQGHDFPRAERLTEFSLVIHCGACMWNRREMLSRMMHCADAGVPITNYGLAIAFLHGILERALGPFPDALSAYKNTKEPHV